MSARAILSADPEARCGGDTHAILVGPSAPEARCGGDTHAILVGTSAPKARCG